MCVGGSAALREFTKQECTQVSKDQTNPRTEKLYRNEISKTLQKMRSVHQRARHRYEAPRAQQHVKQRPRRAEFNGNRDGRPLPGRGRPNCISAPSPNARASRDASNELLHTPLASNERGPGMPRRAEHSALSNTNGHMRDFCATNISAQTQLIKLTPP